MREYAKDFIGSALSVGGSKFRYKNCVFVLSHMRSATTALSNIFCSRSDFSGFGESHIRYVRRSSVGNLVRNHMARRAWNPRASLLFDKILHSKYDMVAPPEFFDARAVFVVREPEPAIHSIRNLFSSLNGYEYETDEAAAAYYVGRVEDLLTLWSRFPADQRVGLTHDQLMSEPDAYLAHISDALCLEPRLINEYRSHKSSRARGGGDPLMSGKYTRLEKGARSTPPRRRLDVTPDLTERANDAYTRFAEIVSGAR